MASVPNAYAADAPGIDSTGSVVTTTTPTITGTGTNGDSVDVYINTDDSDGTNPICTATVGSDGTWSCTVSSADALTNHTAYTIDATQTDGTSTSDDSQTVSFTVDTDTVTAPAISSPAGSQLITSTATPTVSGTTDVGDRVEVYVDGTDVGPATVDGDGNWSFATTSALSDGVHSVYAVAQDTYGKSSAASDTTSFTVDTATVDAPTISSPAGSQLITSTATPTISGATDPGDAVEVYVDGADAGAATVDENGNWTFISSALSNGVHSVYAVAQDTYGKSSAASDTTSFTVDTATVNAPTISSPAGSQLVTSTATPTVSGKAGAGDTVEVYVDGSKVGAATADSSGGWSFAIASALSNGVHSVYAVAQDANGVSSVVSSTTSFTVDTAAVNAPVLTAPAAGAYVSSATPTINGTGTSGDTVEVFIDGANVGKATVSGSGSWSFTVPSALASGSHSITATESDRFGKTSAQSAAVAFTVQTQAPTAPVIVSKPAAATTSTSATFTFNAPAANTSYRFSLDGGSWSTGGSTYSASNLAFGSHSLAVETVTASGLVSSETVYTWTVYRASGPQGLPSSTKASVASKITPSVKHGLVVQVRLNAGSIKQAVVGLYHNGKLIGRATLKEAKTGHTTASVRVYLNAYGRKLLARSGSKGLKATVQSTVTPYAFAALKGKANTTLYQPRAHVAL